MVPEIQEIYSKLSQERAAHNATKRQLLDAEEKLNNPPEHLLSALKSYLKQTTGAPVTQARLQLERYLAAHSDDPNAVMREIYGNGSP